MLLQALATGCALVMGLWVALPWPGVLALLCLGGGIGLARVASKRSPGSLGSGYWIAGAACTLVFLLSLVSGRNFAPDLYYGIMAWFISAALLAGALPGHSTFVRAYGKTMGMTWALLGSLLWLAGAYWHDLRVPFYFGLLSSLGLLVITELWFRLPAAGIQVANTLILLIVGLPVADLFYRPAHGLDTRPETGPKWYSYEAAKRDPAAFGRWWRFYLDQWDLMGSEVYTADPSGVLPFRLRPGAEGHLFESRFTINRLGFRGKEFQQEKGTKYRIVTLGESTTFGCTLRPEDKPWPEVLEQIIRQRVPSNRPVEVINAGVPSYNIKHGVYRFVRDVLPLKPDLVISYHGANGFRMLDNALPGFSGRIPPLYRPRPLKLLADCEYRLKVIYRRECQTSKLLFHRPSFSNVMDSEYARAYQELIQVARTNGVRLALANYSMAVNSQSEPGPVEFYGSMFPGVIWHIRANLAHSQLVEQLVQQHPEVSLVDTHPGLDGHYGKYIDLVHFTQEGRQQLAENIYAAIRGILEEELCRGEPAAH